MIGQNLEIEGNIKINTGQESQGKVLTSDTNGIGDWESIDFHIIRYLANLPDGVQRLLDFGESPINIWKAGIRSTEIYGKEYQGGLIFIIDTLEVYPDWNTMIVAKVDLSAGSEWGCRGMAIDGMTDELIGSGSSNTDHIVVECSTSGIAAKICSDSMLEGFDDWFLPSKMEMDQIKEVIYDNNLSSFSPTYYWTSTQSTGLNQANQAIACKFFNNTCLDSHKDSMWNVRAVRRL